MAINLDALARQAGLELPWYMPSPDAQLEREKLLRAQYFLVRIAGNGDVWRCKRCGTKHTHLTLMCVEQPFSGLTGGLYAYYKVVGMQGVDQMLPPGQRARYQRLAELFGAIGAPDKDLATQHPETARRIATAERDADLGAFALGLLEPITKLQATERVRAINMRGIRPPLRVPGIDE